MSAVRAFAGAVRRATLFFLEAERLRFFLLLRLGLSEIV